MVPKEILMVNDGSLLLQMMACLLETRGYHLILTDYPDEALVWLSERNVNLVIMKLNGEQADRLAVMHMVKELDSRAKLIILGDQAQLPAEVFEVEADDYVLLPCRLAEIWRRLCRHLGAAPHKSRTFREHRLAHPVNRRVIHNLRLMFHDMQGQTAAIAKGLDLLKRTLNERCEGEVETIFQETFQRTQTLLGISEEFLQKFRHEAQTKPPKIVDLKQNMVRPSLAGLGKDR